MMGYADLVLDKIPKRSGLRKRGIILAHGFGGFQFTVVGKAEHLLPAGMRDGVPHTVDESRNRTVLSLG